MQRVLLGSNDSVFNAGLTELLNTQYFVQSANDGAEVLELMHQFEPDVLCVDLYMDKLDTLTVIHNIRMSGRNIPIIVTATSIEDWIVVELDRLRVDRVCLKPLSAGHLANLIKGALFAAKAMAQDPLRLEDALDLILRDMGFRMGSDRYYFVRCAILAKYNQLAGVLMKNIYLDIATAFNVQFANVEKAIRDAIKAAWKNGDLNIWQLYFDTYEGRCPTNEEFITTIAVILQKEGRRRKAVLQQKK